MKYILCLILLFGTANAKFVENVQATSFDVSYEKLEDAKSDALIVLVYGNKRKGDIALENISKKNIPTITKVVDISKLKPTKDNYYIIGKNNGIMKFTVTGLKPSTDFFAYTYSYTNGQYFKHLVVSTKTLAPEPKEPSTNIIFKNTDTDNLYITWKDAPDSEGSLLLVSKDKPPISPVDGLIYEPNPVYGTNSSVTDGMTYSLYAGKKEFSNFLHITNLKYGTYYFQVYSYNGGLGDINYNLSTTKSNPRSVMMKLPPPKLLDNFKYLGETFEIHWEKVEGATTYEVQAAYDNKFANMLDNYDAVDVSNTLVYEVIAKNPEKEIYIRVRAKNGRNLSNWSNILEVQE